jgi:8-oxo-dGTP pyrophosphatase MutT (NUDIX family)
MPDAEAFSADPRFRSMQDALAPLARTIEMPGEAEEDRAHAAVSLVLRAGSDLEVLLIKRAEMEGDPWSGQMALPGGRRDRTDSTLLETAIRETLEETSVTLGDGLALGQMEPLEPATRRLPPITIFPFVFGVSPGTRAQVNSHEVDEVLWVPVGTLQRPETAGTVEIRYREGSTREFPCWRVGGRVVWGLTYRILTRFFEVTRLLQGSSSL